MPRPFKCRKIYCSPKTDYFKPRAIPVSRLEVNNLTMDELEAIRLADLEGLYQEEAAKQMSVSRQTFGNIIRAAHRKIADALLNGKAIKIEGGVVAVQNERSFKCVECGKLWNEAYGTGRPTGCPYCKSREFHRGSQERGKESPRPEGPGPAEMRRRRRNRR